MRLLPLLVLAALLAALGALLVPARGASEGASARPGAWGVQRPAASRPGQPPARGDESPAGDGSVRSPARPGASLRGRVVDVRGTPLPEVSLELEPASGGVWHLRSSAADGSFEVLGLDPGPWRLRAHQGGAASTELEVVLARDAQRTEVELVLRRARELTLRLLDREGRPLAVALHELRLAPHQRPRVELVQPGLAARELDGAPFLASGGGRLEVVEATPIHLRLILGETRLDELDLDPDPPPREAILRADPRRVAELQARLTLHLDGSRGAAALWFRSPQGPWHQRSLGRGAREQGFDLPLGTWELVLIAPGFAFARRELDPDLTEGWEWHVAPAHAQTALTLRGRVRDEQGAALSAQVTLELRIEDGRWRALPPPLSPWSEVGGELTQRDLTGGTYRAACAAGGPWVEFDLPRAEPLEVPFAPGSSARARSTSARR